MTATMVNGLPGSTRRLDLTDVLDAYNDPEVSWAITRTGHFHHLTREGKRTLCGQYALPSSEPSWPHGICRPCLDARVDRPAPPKPKPAKPQSPPARRRSRNVAIPQTVTQRLDQCNRLHALYSKRSLDAHGDLVWLKGTDRPNVDPIARDDARTSCADMFELWNHIWITEALP